VEVDPSFGRLIKTRRRSLDLTQEDLARRVGYSVITIRKVESDERRPSRQLAERLARCLNIDPDERPAFVSLARATGPDDRPELAERVWSPGQEDRPPTNLPSPLTRLIGREQDVADVRTRLLQKGVRLVSLVGPPGIGKTRLGLQVAADVLHYFPDGVYFIGLAPLSDPALVVPTIARTLGVGQPSADALLARLVEHLQDRRVLLLADNTEHMLDAAPEIAELLTACPGLRVLATSRAPLHLSGERLHHVPPLSLPAPAAGGLTAAAAARYAAVELFVERAQAVNPGFALTDANAADVAAICAGVDGLPLAIELIAARAKLLTPHAMRTRLGHRLTLLTGGPRDLPARQQTLRSTIDWSYNLLEPGEQALFARLAVFIGGCSLDAAERVCNAEGDLPVAALDGLAGLADKNLLRQEERADGEPYFVFFETIREYALERLAGCDSEPSSRSRYATYYLALAETADQHLAGEEQETWLNRLQAEHDNFRAVMDWFVQHRDAEAGLRLVAALWTFWHIRGHQTEARRWISLVTALADGSDPRVRARALFGAGWIAVDQSDHAQARIWFEESAAHFRAAGDDHGLAGVLQGLGLTMIAEGHTDSALKMFTDSLAVYRKLADEQGIAWSLDHLGNAALSSGDYERAGELFAESFDLFSRMHHSWGMALAQHHRGLAALALFEPDRAMVFLSEGLALFEDLGNNWGMATSLDQLGYAALSRGDPPEAGAYFDNSLSLYQAEEDRAGMGRSLAGMASVAVARERWELAAHLFGVVHSLDVADDVRRTPLARARYEQDLAAVRSRLDDGPVAAAWEAGAGMPLGDVVSAALAEAG
jgi:predicted ATPase/DNA-binding XRE family transcriptional regulator